MMEGTSFSLNEILGKIPISTLWIGFVVFVAIAVLAGLALIFHWREYKLHSPATDFTQIIYIVGLVILIVLCGISLLFFSAQ